MLLISLLYFFEGNLFWLFAKTILISYWFKFQILCDKNYIVIILVCITAKQDNYNIQKHA